MNKWIVIYSLVLSQVFAQNLSNLTPAQKQKISSLTPAQMQKMSGLTSEQSEMASNLTPDQLSTLQDQMRQKEQKEFVEKGGAESELDEEMPSDEEDEIVTRGRSRVMFSKRYATRVFSQKSAKFFATSSNQVSSDYPLKYGDKLVLSIWGGPEKDIPLTLDRSGSVVVPDAGRMSLNGLTLYSAEKFIKRKLAKSIVGLKLGVVQISLRVRELSPMKIYVLGNVRKPSAYILQGNSSILNALYKAGGPNEIGSVRKVKITRGRKNYNVDLYDYLLKGKLPQRRLLRDGDVIYVPKAEKLVQIQGAVNRAAVYEMREAEGFKELLQFAEGKIASGSYSLSMIRFSENGSSFVKDVVDAEKIIKGDMSLELQNADVISLKNSAEVPTNYVLLNGSVLYPGRYELDSNLTLGQLFKKSGGLLGDAFNEGVLVNRLQEDGTYGIVLEGLPKGGEFVLQALDRIEVPSLSAVKVVDYVSVSGAIQKPQRIPLVDGLTAKTLFLKGGGGGLRWKKGEFILESRVKGKAEISSQRFKLEESLLLQGLEAIKLKGGERLVLPRDSKFYSGEMITVEGRAVIASGNYPLAYKGEELSDFLKRVVRVSGDVQWSGAKFFRKRGKSNYPISLNFNDVLRGGDGGQIKMRGGDRISIPEREFTVRVLGEVTSPGDVLYSKGLDYEDYVNRAGGYNRFADEERVLVVLANGAKVKADELEDAITAGSSILVSYIPEEKPIEWGDIFRGMLAGVTGVMGVILTYVIIDEKLNPGVE
jgi:protein involved in polysaccharide export with SLBB domain